MKTAQKNIAATRLIQGVTTTRPKKVAIPKTLPSRQWLSESTSFQVEPPANGSGSASGSKPLPDVCKVLGPIPGNATLKEEPVLVYLRLPDDDDGLGLTRWKTWPQVSPIVVCDGARKLWVCRVASATCQQEQFIGTPEMAVDMKAIEDADCARLKDMDRLIRENMGKVSGVRGYLPVGYVKAHEDVHLALNSEAARMRYAEYVARINAITRPCNAFLGPATARESMGEELVKALIILLEDLRKDVERFASHKPAQPFLTTQSQFCAPFLAAIAAGIAAKCQ